MNVDKRIAELEKENQKLREEKETLIKIITQMNQTLNRFIGCYISEES